VLECGSPRPEQYTHGKARLGVDGSPSPRPAVYREGDPRPRYTTGGISDLRRDHPASFFSAPNFVGHQRGISSSAIGSVPSRGSVTERRTAVTVAPGKLCLILAKCWVAVDQAGDFFERVDVAAPVLGDDVVGGDVVLDDDGDGAVGEARFPWSGGRGGGAAAWLPGRGAGRRRSCAPLRAARRGGAVPDGVVELEALAVEAFAELVVDKRRRRPQPHLVSMVPARVIGGVERRPAGEVGGV
jgi:hypothetical protein